MITSQGDISESNFFLVLSYMLTFFCPPKDYILSFFFLKGCTCGIWGFPGEGMNWSETAAGLHHSPSKARSKPCLCSSPQFMAVPE